MAIQRLGHIGYGQLELNNVAFRRDGRVEAQCAADLSANSSYFTNNKIENGMLLAVDNVKRTVSLPTADSKLVALVYSAEHLYDERAMALKDFALNGSDDFLPRLGYLAKGDKFTTNTVSYNTTAYANDSAALAAVASGSAFGTIDTTCGAIALVSAAPSTGIVLKAVKKTTMPDGQDAIQFQVIAD